VVIFDARTKGHVTVIQHMRNLPYGPLCRLHSTAKRL